jgi:hypothetical protein
MIKWKLHTRAEVDYCRKLEHVRVMKWTASNFHFAMYKD